MRTFLSICSLAVLGGCAESVIQRNTLSDASASLPESLARSLSMVDTLEKSGASKSEWTANIEAPLVEITTQAQLDSLILEGASASQKTQARELLEQGHHLTLLPYLGYSVLVSFEDEKPKVVIRLDRRTDDAN